MTDTRAAPSAAEPADQTGPGVRIDLLGALRVRVGDDTVALGPPAQQRLLGVLALHPGKVMSKADLVDLLWGTDPPPSCQALLYTYVARLRRLLAPATTDDSQATVIRRQNGGYGLFPARDRSDLLQFNELVARLPHIREPGNGTGCPRPRSHTGGAPSSTASTTGCASIPRRSPYRLAGWRSH